MSGDYGHILDEDRKKNAQLVETAFYNKENLNPDFIIVSLWYNRDIKIGIWRGESSCFSRERRRTILLVST